VGLLVAFVLLASQLEVRRASQTVTAGDLSATLTWSSWGRRGLAAPLTIEVVSPPGISEITVMINSDYLSGLDHNAWIPEPQEMRREGTFTALVYPASEGRLVAELDSRFAPSIPPGRHLLEVWVEAGEEKARFRAASWLVP
jgi:hypothetical protein